MTTGHPPKPIDDRQIDQYLPPMFTPSQVAKRYGVRPQKVLGWIHSGELAAIDVATRGSRRPRYRISRDAIEAFERARSVRNERVPRRRSDRPPGLKHYVGPG